MNKIDIRAIQEEITSEDFVKAKKCPYLLYDENYGAALWHKCYCNFAPKDRGTPQSCNLVWRGECIQTQTTPPDPQHNKAKRQDCADCLYPERSCSECINKAREPKPLAQYLDEYIEHEVEAGNISPEVSELFAYNSWRELLEQAFDAYQSTENVTIKIERV